MNTAQTGTKKLVNKKYLIPSILAIGLVPLIVHQHEFQTHLTEYSWFMAEEKTGDDYFLFYKMVAVILLGVICLILLAVRSWKNDEDLPWEKKAFLPMIVFCMCAFLSACFAKNHILAFGGGYSMFQSVFAILSYMVLFYYTYSCMQSEEHVLYLLRESEFLVFIELLIAVLQVFGYDPLSSPAAAYLIINPAYWPQLDGGLAFRKEVYGTIYAVDYLSVYVALLTPLAAVLLIADPQKKRKWFHGVILGMCAVIMIGGSSSGGRLAVLGGAVVGILVLMSRSRKKFLVSVVVLAAAVIAAAAVVQHSDSLKAKVQEELVAPWAVEEEDVPIAEITTGGQKSGVKVELKDGRTVRFTFSIGDDNSVEMKAYDKDNKPLALTLTDESTQNYVFDDPAYSDMSFHREGDDGKTSCIAFLKDGRSFYFLNGEDYFGEDNNEGYYLIAPTGRLETLPQDYNAAKVNWFPAGFLNYRGRLWDRCITLLPHYIVVGAGADNFIVAYPQTSFINDYYIFDGSNMIDVKAHSYYLQVWIQEGFIAFLCVIALFLRYLVWSVKQYRKVSRKDTLGVLGFGAFLSVLMYLIAMLANDSMVCTAPVFWCIFGMGWGINHLRNGAQV